MNRGALLEAARTLGLTISPGLFETLSAAEADRLVALAETGKRHAKVDLERLDTAIRTLLDVRYDDEPTRAKARKALDAILAVPDPEDLDVSEAVIVEAAADGSTWEVLLIQPGLSANRRHYRREVLQAAIPLFEGVRSFAPPGGDHWKDGNFGKGRGPRELVGWFTEAKYAEGISLPSGKIAEGVTARYHVSEAAPWLKALLTDGWKRGKPDLIGFSIVGDGKTKVLRESGSGRTFADVERITAIESVDPVVHPAAGGMTLRLVASKEGAPVDWARLTLAEAVKGLATGTILPDELKANRADLFSLVESGQITEVGQAPAPVTAEDIEQIVEAKVEAKVGAVRTAQATEVKIAARTGLPDSVKARIRARVAGQSLDESALDAAIKDEVDYAAGLAPAIIRESGGSIVPGKSEQERIVETIYGGLKDDNKFSIKSMYVDLTGDRAFSGKLAEGGRLTESITTSTFAEIMADSVTRRMLDYYAMPGLDSWRQIASVGRVTDFRTQRRIRYGGYGNLPAVAQGAAYAALTSPGDEEATFSASKRGGTEDLTMETIVNDDLGALRDIPRRLGRAAAQTLHEFVWDFLATNGAIYDAVALFHATHGGNLATTALDATSLKAARLVMRKQTDMSNSKRLGINPRFLVVPSDLEGVAYELTATDREVASANNTLNFVRTFGLGIIVVEYLTDTNNWFLVASPADVPTIEVGFLNGQESPELFLQDQPTVGNVFSNDKLTYKVRHIYGGAVLDFRGFTGNIVV